MCYLSCDSAFVRSQSREETTVPQSPSTNLGLVPNADDRLLTVAEASTLLHLSRRKTFDLLACGDLTRVKIGRSTRIRLSDAMRIVKGGAA